MKLRDLLVPVCILTLGACTTYATENVSNTEQVAEVAEVVEDVTANETEVTVADTEEAVDVNRMICKRTVVTGSRFTKKVCMTWGQWRDQAEEAKKFTRTSQGRSRTPEGSN